MASDNPYRSLPDECFWRRAVSRVFGHELDPVVDPRFTISPREKVFTAGSCFAQHIARALRANGFGYLVTEDGTGLPEEERRRRGYGVFTARYGNIYTAKQLLDLVQEAFDGRMPHERVWKRDDGRLVDPYRPRIEPDGFGSEEELFASREEMLEAVRRMVREGDVFIFTLGLTESWISRRDGSAFPLAPGVAGGRHDPSLHAFHNYTVFEVLEHLEQALLELRSINPRLKVLLTVSPVPLIATYERRHVLVSTTYSKSVLRVAAEELYRKYPWVDYFPSFEIINSHVHAGNYFEDDLRTVAPAGVAHAMRIFLKHYARNDGERQSRIREEEGQVPEDGKKRPKVEELVCDEEAIDAAARS